MNTRLVLRGVLAAVSALIVLSGCPNPITEATFLQMTDRNPPTVDVASPVGGTAYTQTVVVQGTALDGEGRLKGVAWTVTGALGLLEEGEIPESGIGAGGAFGFQFSTLTYSGPIAVTVEAIDWNDNVGQATVTLTEPDGQLSSFAAAPANKRVTLDWDEVDGATYTVYYTTNGTIPTTSDLSVSPSAPPYDLPGLQNGDLHTFLLRAHLASGTDYWSGYVKAIPLSVMTLAPQVSGAYQQIDLAWNSIDATDEFVVQRSLSPSGPWSDYTGVIVGTGFTDNAVSDGAWYYYRVRPAFEGSVVSVANGAQTYRLPPYVAGSIISLDTPGTPVRLKAKGTKVFIAAGAAGLVVVDVAEPYDPRVIATFPTTNAKDIELDATGNYAFIADWDWRARGGQRFGSLQSDAGGFIFLGQRRRDSRGPHRCRDGLRLHPGGGAFERHTDPDRERHDKDQHQRCIAANVHERDLRFYGRCGHCLRGHPLYLPSLGIEQWAAQAEPHDDVESHRRRIHRR